MSKQIALSLAIVLFATSRGAAADLRCPLKVLSTDGLASPIPISFDQFEVHTEATRSAAVVRITNRAPRPINAIFMVVDFYLSGRYLLSMPFYLATSAQEASFVPAARISSTLFAPSPVVSSLLPGQSYRDSEESAVALLACPDEARVAVLQIAFAGKSLDRRSHAWRVDPSISHIDPWSSSGLPNRRVSVFSRISVNEQGRVRVIAMSGVGGSGRDDPALSSWLTDQIEANLTYVPAQYDGAAISSEMNILVRFDPSDGSNPFDGLPQDWVKSGITIVDVISRVNEKGYGLRYGGYPMFEDHFEPKSH